VLAAERDDVGLTDVLMVGLEGDEGARGFAPSLIRAGDYRSLQHALVTVEHAFHLDGGDVLAAGNDDVLEAILDLYITIRVADRQVAGVEPAAGKGFLGGAGVFQVALHHGVAAHEDFTDGLAVAGCRFHGFRIADHHAFQGRVAHALAGFYARPFIKAEFIPLIVPGTHGDRAVDLGQAVDVGALDAHFLHRADYLGRRRSAGDHGVHWMVDGCLGSRRHVDQCIEHDGRAAHVGDLLVADQGEDFLRIDTAQEHMHAGQRGHGPGVAPAVAVEHRQGPQVHRLLAHRPGHLVAEGVQVGAPVVVHHTLGVAGGA